MVYKHKDIILKIDNSQARLYKAGKLLFKGNSWTAILQMCSQSNQHPSVLNMFKNQLAQREKAIFDK